MMTSTPRSGRHAAVLVALLGLAATPALAEEPPSRTFSDAELDQMLAPIALYPDALLAQVLMAATYPIEVVQAARWLRAHPDLQGDAAVAAAEDEDWAPSVQSLLAFPQLLERMDEQLAWTQDLGDAFLAQEGQLMDRVQTLRSRARSAGYLDSDEHLRVDTAPDRSIVIASANPRVVYVPYYEPQLVYGPWGWPSHPPLHWRAWHGYTRVRPGFWWGFGVPLPPSFFFGGVSWPHRHVRVVHGHVGYGHPRRVRRSPLTVGRWHHAPHHRRGARYRTTSVRHRYAHPGSPGRRLGPDRHRPHRRATPPRRPSTRVERQRAERREARDRARDRSMRRAERRDRAHDRAERSRARTDRRSEARSSSRGSRGSRSEARPSSRGSRGSRSEARPQRSSKPRMEGSRAPRRGATRRSEAPHRAR